MNESFLGRIAPIIDCHTQPKRSVSFRSTLGFVKGALSNFCLPLFFQKSAFRLRLFQPLDFRAELEVSLVAFARQCPRFNRFSDGALLFSDMPAIAETALRGDLFDFRKGVLNAALRRPHVKLARPWCINHETAIGQL